jgi:hypothetical protein
MSLTSKTLLFLSAEHFQAYSWESGKLSEPKYFTNDSAGRDQFSEYLKQHRNPAYLLVDVIEEDFRQETVPHLTGGNRRALIARKFEQYYRNTLFRQARVMHRQSDGRRDDEMLFSALTNPQRISPWLDTLLNNSIPIIGIHSLPNISLPLLKEISSDHVLLLSWEKHAGLRQTYFNKKRLHFSRLTPINSNNSFSESVAIETPRTQQYLKSLSLPPPGEMLDVYIVCHANDKLAIESRLQSTPELHYSYLDIQTLGKNLKAKSDYLDSDATKLFLHLLAVKPPSTHYANSVHTHFYLLWQLRLIFFGFAVTAALVSILWSGISFMEGQSYVSETEPILSQATQSIRQADEIKSKFPISTVPAVDMKTAVAITRKLTYYSPLPEEILLHLTDVLDKFVRIRTNKILWQTSAADSAPSAYPAQVITFEGELTDFGTDYRNALAYLDEFQQGLTQHGYTVTALTLPLDLSSKGSISGDVLTKSDKTGQFKLKLIWRQKE